MLRAALVMLAASSTALWAQTASAQD